MAINNKSTFKVGFKALLSLSRDQDTMKWYESKLTQELFVGNEVGLYETFIRHLETYNRLPALETLFEKFPEFKQIPIPEPTQMYLDQVEERYQYNLLQDANIRSNDLISKDKTKVKEAFAILNECAEKVRSRELGKRIISLKHDAPKIVLAEYHDSSFDKSVMRFHWDKLDFSTKGASGGDFIAMVGRPQAGKSWIMLRNSWENLLHNHKSSLFVSMEMNHLAMTQRFTALSSSTPITGLKTKQYSTPMYNMFKDSLVRLPNVGGDGDVYIVDGNLAADIEDIYLLAQQLDVDGVYIDGAYLCRLKNDRLGRYDRVTSVAESIKRYTTALNRPSFTSWQFNREAVAKNKGNNRGETTEAGLENIGMTDAVGQLASVVLGLMQQKSVETLNSRTIDILKGRDGETGRFKIHWDFINMNFSEYTDEEDGKLDYI